MREEKRYREPVFIGGAGRSGTTLLVDLLGSHPGLSPVYETEFVIQFSDWLERTRGTALQQLRAMIWQRMDRWSRPLPKRPHHKREHERYLHGPHYILFDRGFALEATRIFLQALGTGPWEPPFRAYVEALFGEHARRDGKPRWINKTPGYVETVPRLMRVFPEMRFIHCVRDGRDAACSVLTRPWGPSDFAEAGDWWVGQVGNGIEAERRWPDRCLQVRYEDLLRDPAETLDHVFRWLGLEADTKAIVDRHRRAGITLDPRRVGGWRGRMSDADRRDFAKSAAGMLASLGYPD